MRRRDLVRAAALAAGMPRGRAAPPGTAAADGWRFTLDARSRWSLAPARGAAVVAGGEVAVELAGAAPVPLRALEGVRRFRTGGRGAATGWSVVGTTDGVEISARFVDGRPDTPAPGLRESPWPLIAVSARGLGTDRSLVAVHFLDTASAQAPLLRGRTTGGPGPALLVNGYQSWSPCRVLRPGGREEETGHWQLATLDGPARRSAAAPTGLGLAFGVEDGGDGRFVINPSGIRAVSHFGRRLLGAAYPPALATLALAPSDGPLEALADLAARSRALPLPPQVPAGWCSWYELYGGVTEDDVVANLAAAERAFDGGDFRIVQVDDGFQRAAGDWETNAKFPHGHRWLTDRIHDRGYRAGLWLAPFAVAERSGIPLARPEWLLRDERGEPLVLATRDDWGGRIFGLDASLRGVQEHLRGLLRHATADWGYDYLKLDFLHYGAEGTRDGRWQSGAEAYRAGLRAMREGAGNAFLLGCGAPLQHSVGAFDGMRIGEDVGASWEAVQPAATAALRRAHLHRHAWFDDPDALVVREPLTLEEARAWVSVVALTGQLAMASDRLDVLPRERVELLQRAVPPAPVSGRALDLATPDRLTAPALWAGSAKVADLPARWRFRAGDDPAWSDPALDDLDWTPIVAGTPWEDAGHPGLDGFAWYRVRFTAPARAPAGPLALELGRIDDADETFVNGRPVGTSGGLPPRYVSEWQAYRRYAVPREAVRWGGENVVAIRAYDGGGPGGLYSFRRDRPPSWVLAGVRDGWWMLAAVNWDEVPRRMSTDLAAIGLAGPLAVYDVWRERREADVDGRWSGVVAARSATVVSLRRRTRWPCVIGTTRHVVQGAVDLADERWDARGRVLRGRALRLDGRPYAVTIALPAGFEARSCRADAGCRLEADAADRTASAGRAPDGPRAVRLIFPAPAREVSWEVAF
jgi:alpha-galactosidase